MLKARAIWTYHSFPWTHRSANWTWKVTHITLQRFVRDAFVPSKEASFQVRVHWDIPEITVHEMQKLPDFLLQCKYATSSSVRFMHVQKRNKNSP